MKYRGLIEGFYGAPWSEVDRVAVGQWCAARGMTHYVYAPKDDLKHRHEWRVPYDADELATFDRLIENSGLTFGFAISPGLSIDYGSEGDRAALRMKLDSVIERGVKLVCLLLDDIPPRPDLGADQANLCRWLVDSLPDGVELVLVPTEYVGVRPSPYLDALAAAVPETVPIAWTGLHVVNDQITAEEVNMRADAVGGRAPLLWDNYPVNDGMMGDSLFMGPLRGRDPALCGALSGWLANPMVQPRSSMLALASVAAFLNGQDPQAAWEAEADAAGLRTFAEACDGAVPLGLARSLALSADGPGWSDATDRVEAWMTAARDCVAPGLENEAGDWVEQTRSEARLALRAIAVLRAAKAAQADRTDAMSALAAAGPLFARWPAARRARVSVLGRRFGFSPVYGQGPDATWVYDTASLREGDNALDILCRVALEALAVAGRRQD